jgi:hypothetical protein
MTTFSKQFIQCRAVTTSCQVADCCRTVHILTIQFMVRLTQQDHDWQNLLPCSNPRALESSDTNIVTWTWASFHLCRKIWYCNSGLHKVKFINFIHSLVIITAFRFFHICFYLSSTTFVAYHLLLVALLINPRFSFVRLFFSCCTRSNHKDQDCYWLNWKPLAAADKSKP